MQDVFNSVLNTLASNLGLGGTSLLVMLLIFSFVCQCVGKSIPDDKTGVLGFVRQLCKILGLYVSNRITSSDTVASVAKDVAGVHDRVGALESTAVVRGPGGKFQANPVATLIVLALIVPMLFGCANPALDRSLSVGVDVVCKNVSTAQGLLMFAKQSKRVEDFQRILLILQTVCPAVYEALPPETTVAPIVPKS